METCDFPGGCQKIGKEIVAFPGVGGLDNVAGYRCREHMPLTPAEEAELALLEQKMDASDPEADLATCLLPFLGSRDTELEAALTRGKVAAGFCAVGGCPSRTPCVTHDDHREF